MKDNERDNLWELLGNARKPDVSPFFTGNVLRKIRQTRQQPAFLAWLASYWRVATLSTAAAALALTLFIQQVPSNRSGSASQLAESSDYDVINNLDQLIASQDTSVWIENDSY
jgi:hypothetical protein